MDPHVSHRLTYLHLLSLWGAPLVIHQSVRGVGGLYVQSTCQASASSVRVGEWNTVHLFQLI